MLDKDCNLITYLGMFSDFTQSRKKVFSQFFNICQVIFHGVRQVHQVVEIHWIILHLPHLHTKPRLVSWMGRWKDVCLLTNHVRVEKESSYAGATIIPHSKYVQYLPGRRLREIF